MFFLGEQRKDINERSSSWEDKAAVFQQTERSNNAEDIAKPQRTPQQKEKPSAN